MMPLDEIVRALIRLGVMKMKTPAVVAPDRLLHRHAARVFIEFSELFSILPQ
jgi:hypothetical protein